MFFSSRIIIVLFYQISFLFRFAGWILPAMPALKIILAMWITLPQYSGEFIMYHLLEGYFYKFEKAFSELKCDVCSAF